MIMKDRSSEVKKGKLAIAVCVTVKIEPNHKENIDFSLVWSMPSVHFFGNRTIYKRLTCNSKHQ